MTPTLLETAAGLARTCRCHGAAFALSLVRERLWPDARVLVLLGLIEPCPPRHASVGELIEHRFCARDEIARLPGGGQKSDSLARFDRGDRCLLQTVDRKLAGVVWLSTAPVVELYRGVRLALPADAVYTYRTWTDPARRGRGLQGRRHLAVLDAVRGEGRSRLLCFADDTNTASLRGARKSGCRPVGTIRMSRSGGFRPRIRILAAAWSDLAFAER